MNVDSIDRLWFYYYMDFDLVATNFKHDIVIKPDIEGCDFFVLSENQKKIIFSGGYDDNYSFYAYDIDIHRRKLENKQKIEFKIGSNVVEYPFCQSRGSKLLFFKDDILYCHHFVE